MEVAMVRLNIDPNSPVPIYQQLKRAIILELLAMRLKDGDQLPSIRTLAKILKLNPNTVAKVYYNLEEEGFAESKRGSGFWVKAQKSGLNKLKQSMVEEELKNFLEHAFSLGYSKADIKDLMGRYLNNG
jgi:GntR family transcriptional regulator